MELYAKGQLSYLILTCLLERDYYGLDIISSISEKSNGKINLKKPSVYSNLTRMEKQGFVSAYLKSSDIGPNRKYYSITEHGRNFYNELKEYFDRNNINVFVDYSEDNDAKMPNYQVKMNYQELDQNLDKDFIVYDRKPENENNEVNLINNEVYENNNIDDVVDNDFFDFSSINDNVEDKTQINIAETDAISDEEFTEKLYTEENDIVSTKINETIIENDNQLLKNDSEDSNIEEATIQNEIEEQRVIINEKEEHNGQIIEKEENSTIDEKTEEKKDDAVFLSTSDANEYNKRLYDISKEINRYKKKRSFAEDQLSMTVDSPLVESEVRTKTSIEDFKNSLIDNKFKYGERLSNEEFSNGSYRGKIEQLTEKNENKNTVDKVQDDAVYITNRLDSEKLERAKKIEPPRLKIVTESSKDTRLPAPKRDVTIDPSHKEILSKLYSKTKGGSAEEIRNDCLYDYNDLKDYYTGQNIGFNEYKKNAGKSIHNTNKLILINSVISFILSIMFSAILFAILANTGCINHNTSFLFLLLPALLLFDVAYKYYNYKKYSGWIPSKLVPQWQVWTITVVLIAVIIGLNFACGLNNYNFDLYATTLLLPLVLTFILLPARYYLKRYILVRHWK